MARKENTLSEAFLREIGVNIGKAVEFMRTVFSEVQLLFKDMERQLGTIGVRPVSQSYLYFDSNSSNLEEPHAWLKASMGRLYSSGGSRGNAKELIILEVHLMPERGIDEPIVLAAVAAWAEERTPGDFHTLYVNDWVLSAAPERLEPGVIVAVPALTGHLEGHSELRLVVWPMTRFTNGSDIQKMLIEALKSMRSSAPAVARPLP